MKAAIKPALSESDAFPGAPHPRETTTLVGHENAEALLLDAYRSGRMPQSIILGGEEGIGKATLAWRLARFVFAYPDGASSQVAAAGDLQVPADDPSARRLASLGQPDLALLRREWNEKTKRHFTEIRVEDVRKALSKFELFAADGGWRVCIIDCVDDMNRNSMNAMLKMIEEPPPRSLFLLIAHKPAYVLATIRSRSRLLLLAPLRNDQVARAVSNLGGSWSEFGAEIAMASARSQGSVRQALRLLDSDRLALAQRLDDILAKLPHIDWMAVHALAEVVSKPAATDEFEAFYGGVFDWLSAQVRSNAQASPARLAPLAEVWEKLRDAVRETEALNLDKRALILTMFANLAAAAHAARLA